MVIRRPDDYIHIWDFTQGERQIITIKRMVYFVDEKDFLRKKKMRQKLSSGNTESITKDVQDKKNQEKFYLNAEILGYDGEWFRNDGFSIYRYQLPELISALQSIYDGEHDNKISSKISELINPEENTEPTAEQETDLEEKTEDIPNEEIIPTYSKKIYDVWVNKQPEEIKKAISDLQKDGWTKEKIYNILNSKEYRDCFK